MSTASGITLAFVAMFCWGVGDFCIQKTSRSLGSVKALFLIGAAGGIVLFPFARPELLHLGASNALLLTLLGIFIVIASLFDFEAMRRGKISVVEPIIGLELPITVGLGMTIAGESISMAQLALIASVFMGIMFAITRHHTHLHYHRRIFERGVACAVFAAIGMAMMNFFIGVSSQSISPLMTIWFTHSIVGVLCGIYLLATGMLRHLLAELREYPIPILGQSILDNVAWICFAFATTAIPIAIATTIAESYIAIAVLLGLLIGKERLKSHQKFGVSMAVSSVIVLAALSS